MITVQNLHKSYGSKKAVDGLSLDIPTGETFGFLGPNGAGKTTSIHMMTGVLRPDSGAIIIGTETDPTRPAVRQNIGVVPQALSLYEELTAEENLAFFGRMYGLAGATLRGRVDWGLEFAGLADRRKDRAGTFSGGMKRRLNIACALLHNPPVIFMDEPTVGVDPQSRNLIFGNIETLKREGRTILYTTHYMEEVERLCDRVAIMDNGRILAQDTVKGLIAAHGGRAVLEIEFEQPPPVSAFPVGLNGTVLRLEADKPLEEAGRIAAMGFPFRTLTVHQADLEEVFLNLTGRSLRDA